MLAGKYGYAKFNGISQSFAEWVLSVKGERIERSDIDWKASRVRLGPPLAEVTLNGFYPGNMGLKYGDQVLLALGVSAEIEFELWALFEGPTVGQNVKSASKMDFRFVIDEDFLSGANPLEF